MPDPRPDAEQVIRDALETSQIGISLTNNGWVMDASESAAAVLAALRTAGLPVGPVDALRYAEERLLEDANVEAAQAEIVRMVEDKLLWNVNAYGKAWTGEGEDTDFICGESGHAALKAALRSARGEGT